MAKRPLVQALGNLTSESTAVQNINENVNKLADAVGDLLSTTDTTENTMNVSLDMNGQRILNLPTPVLPNDPIRFQDRAIIRGDKGDKGDPGKDGVNGVIDDTTLFTGIPKSQFMAVGRQASPDGNHGGLLVGGAGRDESGQGTYIAIDGLANWCRVQPSKNYNAQEFNVYGSAAQGFASVSAGGNTITRTTSVGGDPGSPFDPAWEGQTFYWAERVYRVLKVLDDRNLTVTTIYGGPVSFPINSTDRFHFFRTTTRTIVNVNGTQVTRVSGDPLVPFFDPSPDRQDCILKINGVSGYRVAAFQSSNSLTLLTSAGVQNNVVLTFSINIYDQISTIRLQKTTGIDEENLNFMARADGYDIIVSIANGGKYYPLRIKNGDGGGFPQTVSEFKPDVTTIGGVYGQGAFTVKNGVGANRFEIEPSAAGFPAALRSRGSDVNVSATYDAQGSGSHSFTGRSFGQTLFEISGSTLTNLSWIKASPGGTPSLQPNGTDANAPMALLGRGVSGVQMGAYIRNTDPTVADIPSGTAVFWLNTTANTIKIVFNNGGVLRSMALA
jgi:hypothetical protein